ncbi:MAG: VanZ family protein [Clostridia bacterium]|nr:VanZ family protein [Clostridia bacterium]
MFFFRKPNLQIPIEAYFADCGNAVPLKTIMRYFRYACIKRDTESIWLAVSNIGGNLILFLPMGFFLPCLFRALRRSDHTLCVIALTVISCELLQGIFRIGVPDADDMLMNLLGALLGFGIAKVFGFCKKILS